MKVFKVHSIEQTRRMIGLAKDHSKSIYIYMPTYPEKGGLNNLQGLLHESYGKTFAFSFCGSC